MGRGSQRVQVLDGRDFAPVAQFHVLAPGQGVPARLALADVDGDGDMDILVASGAGARARVEVWDAQKVAMLDAFFVSGYEGGLFIAASH